MKFVKMQACGNDFVVVDARGMQRDWSKLAIAICQRHFSIGADGLLLVVPSTVADLGMRIFNPDGSEAEACGNGLRCVAKYAWENLAAGNQELRIETLAGISRVRPYMTAGRVDRVQVSMGIPRFEAEDIPVAMGQVLDITPILDYPLSVGGRELSLTFVSLGNPHAVCFWPEPVAGFPLAEAAPEVGRHSIFPQGVNFEVANMIDRGHLEARVWERGVGETLACGTGACAIAVAARLHGYCHNQVDIKLPGGTLTVDWDGEGEVLLTGPVELAFDGEWPEE